MTVGVLVVTGGSRGIGSAVGRRAAEAGWSVCLSYRTEQAAAEALAEELHDLGVTTRAVRADMSVEADIVGLFAAAAELGPVTGLVANAGVVAPQRRLDEIDATRVRHLFEVNVVAPILCCREAVRRMSTRHGGQGGSIVLMSSAASRLGSPGEYIDYAATKGAVDTLRLRLAKEVAGESVSPPRPVSRLSVPRAGARERRRRPGGGSPPRTRSVVVVAAAAASRSSAPIGSERD